MGFNLVAAVGITLILTMSRIAAPVRAAFTRVYRVPFPKAEHIPVDCSQCMGVWCGWAVAILTHASLTEGFLLGPATSVLAYLTYTVIDKLEA